MHRIPFQFAELLDRLRGEFRRRDVDEDVGVGGLDLHHLRIHRRRGCLVGRFDHDQLAGLIAQPLAQPDHVILAEIVVLIHDADGLAGIILQDVGGVDARLDLIARLPADRPRKALRVVPLGGAAGDENLRHFLGVHVFLDRGIAGRAERVEYQQHLVGFDQLARLLHGLGRIVAVVIGDEADLAAVDAALGIDLVEIGGLGLADGGVGGRRARIGHDVADLDLGVGGARIVFLLRAGRACKCDRE